MKKPPKKGFHRHHKIPKYMGGSDDDDNIVYLTPEEHAQAHMDLYEKYGNLQDLCAYYMLSGWTEKANELSGRLGREVAHRKALESGRYKKGFLGADLTDEQKRKICSKGGRTQGKRNVKSGVMKKARELSGPSEAGKKAVRVMRKRKSGCFFNKKLHKEVASKGGRVQGKRNAESGHLKRIAKLSKGTTGKIWITNGVKNKMIEKTDSIPDGYRKGMKMK